MHFEKEYIELLNIFTQVVEANKGTPSIGDERLLDAEGLALKFFGHVISTLYLYRGITIRDFMIPITNFPDATSIHVLGRAAIETFLIFHYIFVEPENKSEKDFKYFSWQIAGLLECQNFPVWSQDARKQLKQEKEIIINFKKKLEDNSVFKDLSQKEKRKVLEKGLWRLKSWKDIGLSAGFSEIYSQSYYSYLCGYAHSGNLSILQWRQAKSYKEKRALSDSTMNLILIAIANMIKFY